YHGYWAGLQSAARTRWQRAQSLWSWLGYPLYSGCHRAGYWWSLYDEWLGLSNLYGGGSGLHRHSAVAHLPGTFLSPFPVGSLYRCCCPYRTLLSPVSSLLPQFYIACARARSCWSQRSY